jgi:hypothetical protein
MQAAVAYARGGWAVFPCAGKKPITSGGFKAASTNPLAVRQTWAAHPGANIGLALSEGLWALDVDVGKGGAETLRALERKHSPLPFTLRQTTGTGGEHWIFRIPAGVTVRQGAGFAPGLDTRVGGRGYLMVCPSVHPDTGKRYRWHSVVAPVEAPAWLLELVRAPDARMRAPDARPYVPPTASREWIADDGTRSPCSRDALRTFVPRRRAVATTR